MPVWKNIIGRVKSKAFFTGFLNPADFVVHIIEYAAALVGGLNQVAGFVVAVAPAHGAADEAVEFAVVQQGAVGGGGLVFQTAHRVVIVAAG